MREVNTRLRNNALGSKVISGMTETLRESARQLTVMLLIPDILARLAIAEYLRACGYRVLEGIRSDEVFTVLEAKTQVHIILAETRLTGELDGLTLARKVREVYPDIEVYVLAGVPNIAEKATQLCEKGCRHISHA